MNYKEFTKLAPEAKNVYLYDRVEMIVRCISEIRETCDGHPIEFERVYDDEGRTVKLVIKCPYPSVAWLICLVLEKSSILTIDLDGEDVYVW